MKKVETLLQKLLSILHPCHYNCFSVKHSLIQLYGNQMGYPYSSLNDELLNKKTGKVRILLYSTAMIEK